MKKIIAILLISFSVFSLCKAQSITPSPRFGIVPNDDNTGRVLTYFYYTPSGKGPYDSAQILPHGFETFIQPADSIQDTLWVNAYNTRSNVCDKIEFQCVGASAHYPSKHVVFNRGFSGPNLNISVSDKTAYHITFFFDGKEWRETSFFSGN